MDARGSLPAGGSITMRDTAVYSLARIRLPPNANETATAHATAIRRHRVRNRSSGGSKPLSASDITFIRAPGKAAQELRIGILQPYRHIRLTLERDGYAFEKDRLFLSGVLQSGSYGATGNTRGFDSSAARRLPDPNHRLHHHSKLPEASAGGIARRPMPGGVVGYRPHDPRDGADRARGEGAPSRSAGDPGRMASVAVAGSDAGRRMRGRSRARTG